MQKLFMFLLVFYSIAFSSATVMQTDWSGGAGVAGPVLDWGTVYSSSNHMNISDAALKLAKAILPSPVQRVIKNKLNGALTVAAADIDGDGDMDALGGALVAHTVVWLENTNGSGTKWTKHIIDDDLQGVITVLAADIDGDGDMDAACAALTGNEIAWYENTDGDGSNWTKHSIVQDYEFAWSICTVDVNGDGNMDIVGNSARGEDISWWENKDGSGISWAQHSIDTNFGSSHSIYAADVDGDGKMDVLGASYGDHKIAWWRNADGTGTKWTMNIVDDSCTEAGWVRAADLDNDNDIDIIGFSLKTKDIYWHENTDGSGSVWTKHSLDNNCDHIITANIADIDDDGDMDIVGIKSRTFEFKYSTVICWINTNSDGTEWEKNIIDDKTEGLSSIVIADVDGNKSLDLLGAAFDDKKIYWWDCIGFASGTLESSILDAGPVAAWDQFNSSIQTPASTSIGFQFRSSSDVTNMGTWSETVSSSTGSLAGILAESTRYLQYKVILNSTAPLATPTMEEIAFTFTRPTGIEEQEASWALLPVANPSCNGCFSVNISVPQAGTAELALYDVSGRIINRTSQSLTEGNHSINFNNLSEGVYFCVMGADDYSLTRKIVILE